MCTEGIIVADDVVGAGVFAFLGALAFLGAGPAELGAEEGVGAAVERESLDSSSSSQALRTSRCSAIRSMVLARLLTVQVEDIVSRGPI